MSARSQSGTKDPADDAARAFARVFGRANDTDPFAADVPGRLLLYPIDYTRLDHSQFAAVEQAATGRQAYFAHSGPEDQGWAGTFDCRLTSLGSYDDYATGLPLEHFLFDPQGEWGVLTSDWEYALLGGSGPFIQSIERAVQYDLDTVLANFVRDWQAVGEAGGSVEWVPPPAGARLGPPGSRAGVVAAGRWRSVTSGFRRASAPGGRRTAS